MDYSRIADHMSRIFEVKAVTDRIGKPEFVDEMVTVHTELSDGAMED